MTYNLSYSRPTLFQCSYFPISKLFFLKHVHFHKIAASYLSKVKSKVNLKGSNFVLSITATAVTGMTRTVGHNKTSMARLQIKTN